MRLLQEEVRQERTLKSEGNRASHDSRRGEAKYHLSKKEKENRKNILSTSGGGTAGKKGDGSEFQGTGRGESCDCHQENAIIIIWGKKGGIAKGREKEKGRPEGM